MRLENSELRSFIAVIEHNGFNRAAQQLHITQSAVSQSVTNLEKKLDTTLIQRGKQLKLTDAGNRLYRYAFEALREEQQTLEDIERIRLGHSATLSLALNSVVNRYYAPQLLNLFCRQHPHTRLSIQELPSRSIIYAILSGRTELGLGTLQTHMSTHDSIPLYQETRYLVVSPKHPQFTQLVAGNAKTYQKTTLITSFLDEPEKRPALQRIRDQFATVWEISSLSLRIHLVDQGLGVAYIDSKLMRENPICADFQKIEDDAIGQFERQVGIYYKAGKTLSPCAEQFIALSQKFWAEN